MSHFLQVQTCKRWFGPGGPTNFLDKNSCLCRWYSLLGYTWSALFFWLRLIGKKLVLLTLHGECSPLSGDFHGIFHIQFSGLENCLDDAACCIAFFLVIFSFFLDEAPHLLRQCPQVFGTRPQPSNKKDRVEETKSLCSLFFLQSSGKLMFFIFGNHAPGTSAEENCCICRATALAWRGGDSWSGPWKGYQLFGLTPTWFFHIQRLTCVRE